MKISVLAVVLAFAAAGPVMAQSWDGYVVPLNEEGEPLTSQDRLVPVGAGGLLQGLRGRPWWQGFAHCIGAFEFRAQELEGDGKSGEADRLRRSYEERFEVAAVRRLMADRGVSSEDAAAILYPDAMYHFVVTAEEGRAFAQDEARCAAIERAHAQLG
jgi:hypothetical protein